MTETFELDETLRASTQKQTLSTLFASGLFARAGMTLGFPIAALLIKDMLGSATFAGLSTVAITVGTAFSAKSISSYMNRRGRRPGLVAGYLIAAVGSGIALLGAQMDSIIIFLVGLVGIGVGSGASNLSRYAAADLALADRKAKAISFIVFASTIGAVFGPTLVGPADRIGQSFGFDERAGVYVVTAVLFVVGAIIVGIRLRPDPLVLIGGLDSATSPERANFTDSLRIMLAQPQTRLALMSLVVSQAVMVGVMAMTPVHMEAHDHSDSIIGWVISAHVLGMFASAPLAGWAADRFGKMPSIAFGGFVLVLATTLTSLAGDAPKLLLFPGLYLLGLGWSFGMVAGSALLTESVTATDRVSVQGAADLLAAIVSGVAALASGIILTMTGYHILSMIGIAAAGLLLVNGFTRTRQAALAI
jgi:MFS family permease